MHNAYIASYGCSHYCVFHMHLIIADSGESTPKKELTGGGSTNGKMDMLAKPSSLPMFMHILMCM